MTQTMTKTTLLDTTPQAKTTDPHGWRSLVKMLGSVTAVQIIGFVLLPLLGRLYTKEDYGILGTIMALVGLTTILANGRYEQAISVAPTGGRLRLLRVAGIGINLTLTSLLVLLCLLAPSWLAGTDYERLTPYLLIVPMTTLGSGLFAILAATANAQGQYGSLGLATLLQGYVNNALKVVCGWRSMGVWGFATAFNTGLAVAALILGIRQRREDWLRGVTLHRVRVAMWRYRSFPKYTIGQKVVSMLSSSILPLMLPAFYGTGQIGLITMLFMITRRPVQVYSDATGRVYGRRMVQAQRQGRSFLPQMRKLSLRLLGFTTLLMITFPWVATPLVTLILGDQWTELGGIIVWMIPFLLMEGLHFIFDFIPDVLGRQRAFWILQTLRLLCEVGFILLLAPGLEFGTFIRAYFTFAMGTYAMIYGWFYFLLRQQAKG